MIERKLLNDNSIQVIGTLTDVECKEGATKDGRDYISGKITVKVKEKSLELHFFSMKMTKQGAISKLYNTYSTLDTYRGHRVEISGDIDESKIVNGSEIRRGNTLNARFVNLLKETDSREDSATFSIAGFVKNGLTSVMNRDGTAVIDYGMVLGQANYNNSFAKYLRFNVTPSNQVVVNGITNNFSVGDTVKIDGVLDFNIETITMQEENDFGASQPKTVQRTTRRYVITGGKKIVGDEAYTKEEIDELVLGTEKDDQAQVANRGNNIGGNQSPVGTGTTTAARLSTQPKLI